MLFGVGSCAQDENYGNYPQYLRFGATTALEYSGSAQFPQDGKVKPDTNSDPSRLVEFRGNVTSSFLELLLDVIDGLQSFSVEVNLVVERAMERQSPPLSLAAINAAGITLVVGSACGMCAWSPVVTVSILGKSVVLSKVLIVMCNSYGVVSFLVNQAVNICYDQGPGERNRIGRRLVWGTIGVYSCAAAIVPMFDLALRFPLVHLIAYADGIALSMCCNFVATSTSDLRPVVMSKAGSGTSGFANDVELLCSSLLRGGQMSAWLVGVNAGRAAWLVSLLWALWWPSVMPYKPL